MIWQDVVFAVGSIIFSLALIPSIKSRDKPALKTSVTTGVVLTIFGVTYITLGLAFAAATTFVSSGLWLTLAVQRWQT